MDGENVLRAIANNNERMITYLNRHGKLMAGLLGHIDGIYDSMLEHRMALAQSGGLDDFMDHAGNLLSIATQEAESFDSVIASITTANDEIIEALDDRQPV